MDSQNDNPTRLASLLNEVAVGEGMHPTLVEGVQVIRISQPMPRTPLVYPPNIVVVGQGQKRAYLRDEVYVYDPFNYLVLPVPLPAECEANASPEAPVLVLRADPDEREALLAIGHPFFASRAGRDRIVVVLTDDTDWEETRELVTESYRVLAPKKLTALLD